MKLEGSPEELFSFLDKLGPTPPRQPELLISTTAFDECFSILQRHEPEFAGVLLGPIHHASVTHFIPDLTGKGSASSFVIGAKRLNEILSRFVPLGLEAKGFAHSHPPGSDWLSEGDLQYVRKLFANSKNDAREIHMPIVVNGRFLPFVVRKEHPEFAMPSKLVTF
jgi:proteasome lid subunit RPN8/RPN11